MGASALPFVDTALLAIGIEVAAMFAVPALRRRWRDFAGLLLPGALLMVALRLALADAAHHWIVILLAASLPAHLVDLWRRLRGDKKRKGQKRRGS